MIALPFHRDRPWIDPVLAREAYESGTGRGVKIAVIDTGIEADHPRLAGMSLADSVGFQDLDGRIVAMEGEGSDVFGHGTAVAGVIHQFAPEAEIGSFRAIDSRNLSRTALISAAIREALDRGYHILNCSFGCRGLAKFILPHKAWADEAWLRGVFAVAACSNDDDELVEWPAHFVNVFAVGMAKTGSDEIYHRPRRMVEYAARGENVEVAWKDGQVQQKTGSSFAAPRLTAAIARILSVHPTLSPAKMHELLPRIVCAWSEELDPNW
ncbi:MAG: S8 family serine peptidase [Verrucomicrobiae bacterium]|nr:S8 family serine peptidase [Verrucomicrobiae bacterium]